MKKLLLSLIVITISVFLFGQIPNQFKYQAVLRNTDGTIIAEESVIIIFSILKSDLTTSVFNETHTTSTTTQGLINLNIGSIEDLSIVNWTLDEYFIEINVNGTVIGTSQLLSVPYALHAKTVENDAVDDADADPSNEFQNLTLNGTILEISDGTNTDLSSLQDGTGTDDQTLSEVLIENNSAGNAKITNLADPVNDQDAVTKAYLDEMLLRAGVYTIKDYDGNAYATVTIGTQIWMAEDLRVTHYPNGDPIPNVTDDTAWKNLADNNTDDAYCFYNNDAYSQYGALYTWAAAMGDNAVSSATNPSGVQGVCPDGWHLPSDAEWTELTTQLGGLSVAGGEMKETGTTHWITPNTGATNSSGFSALPGGFRRYEFGNFNFVGYHGYWLSSTEFSGTDAYNCHLYYTGANAHCAYNEKSYGFSVRCVMD